jgi:membrane protease YdiL (CAAX protease family)
MSGGADGRTPGAGVWIDTIRRLLAFAGLYLVLTLPLQLWNGQHGPASRARLFVGAAATLAAAVAAGAVMLRGHGRRAGALGFAWTRASPGEIGRGLAIGVATTALAVALMFAARAVHYEPEPGGPAGLVRVLFQDTGLLAVAAAAEEALFRGYPFQLVARAYGPTAAVLLTSAGFALAHAANPHVTGLALANIFLAGVLLAVAYLRTRSLWFATALHLGWNWTLAVLADLPTSGLEMDTPLYQPVVAGPSWLTGGSFGPEGGLVVTVAALLAILVVARWGRLSEGPELRALGPLVDGDDIGLRVENE